MKITGSKKLSIILLSLGCSVAAGLGVMFGGWFSNAPKAYAQSAQHVLPTADEATILRELSQMSGISEEELKFYALSNNGTVESLYRYFLNDKATAQSEIIEFLSAYSQGQLTNDSSAEMEKEDWFLPPDAVSSYDFTACGVGTGDTWTQFYTSKSFITTESFYWRESGFQWGSYQWKFGTGNLANASGNYADQTVSTKQYWDSQWQFDIAWLDEGEEFEFGLYSNKAYNSKGCGAISADFYMDNYLSEKPYYVRDNTYSASSAAGYRSGTTWGIFSDLDYTTPAADSDPCQIGYDAVPTTRGDWKDEFSTSIPCNNGNELYYSNSPFVSWGTSTFESASGTILPASCGGGDYSAGVHKLHVSADAPSGVYYMSFYRPRVGSYWCPVSFANGTSGAGTFASTFGTTYSWSGWNYYINYGVMVCRKGVSAPVADYGDGVSSDLTSKTVNYTGSPQTFVLKNDWGPGMTTVVMEEWDASSNSWIPSTVNNNITIGSRSAAGAGIKGNTEFTATNAGRYRITYTPFRNWNDGSRTPKEYFFEIKPMKLKPAELVQEEGVDQANNKKFLYATRKDLYVSLYPVSNTWATYNAGGLSVFNYSSNGVLTLSEKRQGVYTITVSLIDTVNTSWDDGTTNGSVADLEFTFEIGPEKITVPDIIQDTGQIGAFKKEVTFNGAVQTMSFMPIIPAQLDITVQNKTTGAYLIQGIDYTVSQNTLVVSALDAGRYEIKLAVKPEYIFDELSTELIYELIIYEAEIDAPILDETDVAGTVKTVTYGGEKVTVGEDGTTQDWVATLAFKNADEAHIKWISDNLGQQSWGDSRLVLSARAADTYKVKFEPQKNYKWKPGVNPPEYTLVIEKLKIAEPKLVNDNEAGAKYTATSKTIGFDAEYHPFKLEFPTLAATADTPYTKKSSVFIIHTGSFTEEWDASGDIVTFSGKDAATYNFTVTPTNNYCWADGTSVDKVFVFKIIPINIDTMEMWATDPFGVELMKVPYSKDTGYVQRVSFDGHEKTVRIGNPDAPDDEQKYVTSGDFEKYFFLLDEDGNVINRAADGKTGIEAKLLDNMTASEDGGFLTVTAIDAGTYRIAVYIRNTNFWWTETEATVVVYTLIIEAQGIPQPAIDEDACEGRDIIGHFEKDTVNGAYVMHGVYYDIDFLLIASLSDNFRNYVEITDPAGVTFVYANKTDVEVRDEMKAALSVKGGSYTDWRDGKVRFYAKDQGEYVWKLKVTDSNYKWAATNTLEITYKIIIDRSPVSGIEMHYVGDNDEAAVNGANGFVVGHDNVRGSDPDALKIRYDSSVFSDEEKVIFFKRTNVGSLVKTGFSTQFEYSIKNISAQDGYDPSLLTPLDDHKNFDDEELRLFALDAGTYEITITPSDNYCWNDTGKTTGPVMFTLVIKKRQLDKPVIINDDGSFADATVGAKETEYNHKYQTFALHLEKYPQGYAVEDMKYHDKENRVGDDFEPVRISGTYPTDTGNVNLGADPDAKTLSVQAKSAGEYTLIVTVSNVNNYELKDGDNLEYLYNIKKLMVELPSAYLSDQSLNSNAASKKIYSKAEVEDGTVDPKVKETFVASSFYTLASEFNGKFYTVYFYGSDVAKGDFNFTVSMDSTNGASDIKQILPTDVLVDNPTDNTQEAGYYMLAATAVNKYTITLKFATKDFYWSTETPDADSTTREFIFNITKNKIPVPKIFGNDYENIPLENESYTAEFEYALDLNGTFNTANEAVPQTIELHNVLLGMATGTNPVSPGVYEYSNITVKINAVSLADNAVKLDMPATLTADGKGNISFTTASLVGTDIVIDGGEVTRTYCIELEINPDNSEWDKGDPALNKLYYIKIKKMQVENPYLTNSDIQTKLQLDRHVTYNGNVWANALLISGYDPKFMTNTGSANLIPSGATDPDITVSNNDTGRYCEVVTVNAPAPADTYTVTVKLADTDNMDWRSGGIADIVFSFIVDPIKIAKPYIENSANSTSVVGTTKTVTYDPSNPQFLQIGNYWFDPSATLTPTLANTPASALPSVIPKVMTYAIANGTLDSGYPEYSFNEFAFPGNKYGAMDYNDFNSGLLKIQAENAGRYVIRFTLTSNAVWADGSNADIDITLLVKKIEVPDMVIVGGDSEASVSGTTKTIKYKLDSTGSAVVRNLNLDNYDDTLMGYDGLTSGTASADGGLDGYLVDGLFSGTIYSFTAQKAGEYEVSFKLDDGDNYRWKYADTDMIYFKLIIEKLELNDPVIHTGYKLANESIDSDTRTLTVDYDLREHTILVKSLFEQLNNGAYSGLGNLYFTVADTTATDYPSYVAATHVSQDNAYDTTSGKTVNSIFEILGVPGFSYDGPFKNTTVSAADSIENVFALTAYKPGEYYLTFSLTDTANMIWYNNGTPSANDVKFKIVINKVQHAYPTLAAGELGSKEYEGGDVEFRIVNAFNGIESEDDYSAGTVTTTVSEKYEVISYTGNDTNISSNLTAMNASKAFEKSWYKGTLTLKFTSVGVYTVRVSITDTDNIEWIGWPNSFRDFIITVSPRSLTTEVKFYSDDTEVNAKLEANTGTPTWSISDDVYAQVTIKGLRTVPQPPPALPLLDKVLGFKIYYEISTNLGTELEPVTYDDTVPGAWIAARQPDGTYNLIISYRNIKHGKGNIDKGSYKLHIVQDTTYTNPLPSNYTIADPQTVFIVDADPAPFKTDMLEWYYTRSDAPSIKIPITGIGGDASHRFTDLIFDESSGTPVTYTFYIRLNSKGMQGYDNPPPAAPYTNITDALNSWKVDWNGSYSGTQAVSVAGNNSVYVTITALNPAEYSFANYRFELFYTIRKAQYDLSKLSWDYDGSTKFEFDGTAHTVNIDNLSDPQYAGLTIDHYTTSGTFTSYALDPTTRSLVPVPGTVPMANGNSQTYAGVYTTTIYFKVPANSNYELPVQTDDNSYTGTFAWTREWEITPQKLEVNWKKGGSSSDGTTVTKAKPVIDGTHTGKFKYIYDWYDDVTDPSNPVWVLNVPSITRKPNNILTYRATAYLNSTPSTASTDYARNYTFELVGEDNPLEFEVGGDDVTIINHIEINGTRNTQYEYTGDPFVATNVIDLDTTNGLLDTPNMTITIVYYSASAPTVPLSGAPYEVGSYIVKLKLSYSSTGTDDDYALDEDTYYFEIIKAKLKNEDFVWHVTHNDGENTYEAEFSVSQGNKWINTATKEEYKIAYDGHAYEVTLTSDYASTVISFIFTENNKIDAGTYTATVTPTIDTAHYEIDTTDPIVLTFSWEIEKQFLDLSKISWDYSKPYEFTLVNGTPKAFKAELKDLPEYLLDKIDYTVNRVTDLGKDPVVGNITNAGKYETTATIRVADIDTNNYTLDTWPAAVPSTFTWVINRKEIELPKNDLSWSEFDGVQHNLLKPFGLDVDWAEYFDIAVTYTDFIGDSSAYDGTVLYGGKYYAYNAGIYSFTLKINKTFNTDDDKNIVWLIDNGTIFRTDNDQTISYTVNRKSLKVTGWINNYESSTVILADGVDASKFIEYEFYPGALGAVGTKVSLDTVLASGGGDTFSMVPLVKEAFKGNISLTFETGTNYTTFTTQPIDEQNAVKVNDKPYIYGYTVNNTFKRFSNDELASGETFVIYTGDTVEFRIFNWDYYKDYLTVWNGSLDDLIQSEAGEYSITLVLRKDLEHPLYWGVNPDNTIDRSSVTLKFEIRYRTLPVPEIPTEVTYDGTEINILDKAKQPLATLMAQYGDYVTITGNRATDVGEQILYLAIKDEYGTAVRWSDGTLGTYQVLWKIKPILLVRPEKDETKTIIDYDGAEHSVYEYLVGYDPDSVPQSIKDLMKYVKETNGRSINAGSFEAVLSLPNENYAWCDASGNKLDDRSSVTIRWSINKKLIDFTKAYWGYMDGETPVRYDPDNPYVYTVKNGAAQPFTMQIIGMPDILKLYAKYTTNGVSGNSASAVDTYTTRVEYDLSKIDTNNYTIGNQLSAELSEIQWQIVAREFEAPVYDESWKVYDGAVHDVIEMLGMDEDWAEYFDVKVEYKEIEGDSWSDYDGTDKLVVGYSNYKLYYFGFYRVTVTLKSSAPVWVPGSNMVWKDGTAPDVFVIEVTQRDVIISGWYEDNEYSYVLFKDNEVLPDGIADKFEQVIYEDGDLDKTPVDPADVDGGKTYYIEYRIKDGSDAFGIPYAYGVTLKLEDGVVNPYEFGKFSYPGQTLMWLPMPVLETASLEYNGEKQTFAIKDFDTLYKLTDAQRIALNSNYGLNFDASVKSYIYLQNANSLTATAAGEYTAVVRFLNKVYLSWYDSNLYETSADGRTLYYKGTTTVVTENVYNNKSFILNFKITPKKVPLLSDEDLEKLLGIIVKYDGTEKDVTVEAKDVFDELEAKYGKIFDYAGSKGTAADIYELIISLADNDSSSWYVTDSSEVVEKKVMDIDGYRLEYVQEDGNWKIVLVKTDADGNPVKDASGKYVEYADPDGNYTVDVRYQPKFRTDYVKIDVNGDGSKLLIGSDGKLIRENNYFYDNENLVYPDGTKPEDKVEANAIVYEYQKNSGGEYVRYYEASPGVFVPESLPANPGTHLLRTELSVTDGDKYYDYKIPVMEDATEYTYLFANLPVGGNGKPVPIVGLDGKLMTDYLVSVGPNYELRRYRIDANGEFELDAFLDPDYTVIESTCQFADSDLYSIVSGKYTVDNTNGGYMNRYILNSDGTRKQQISYEKDADGNYVIDQERSVINVVKYERADGIQFVIERDESGALKVTRNEIASGIEYKLNWQIDSSTLAMPVFDETLMQQYTGGKLYAKDVLKGFLPDLMEIVEGGEGVNAGEYTAKIVITSPNSKWDPKDTTENYVLVKWKIGKAQTDLSELKWVYNDGTNTYDDSSSFVYTRKDGKPVVYWVQLDGVPEVLKSRLVYTTNGKQGAYAGISAGKYMTTFAFNTDDNFEAIEIPETLETTITWNIGRRMLEIPDVTSVFMVFDSSSHDLLEVLGVPEDWNEYYDIEVKYSDGGEFVPYEGKDGNPYIAYDSGEYMFTFTIKQGINTSSTNPNVVWLKKSGETEVPVKTETETAEDEPAPAAELPAPSAPATFAAVKEEVEETDTEAAVNETEVSEERVVVTEMQEVEQPLIRTEKSVIEQVCDRLKKLMCGAEVQLNSFRKFSMRGTL